MTEINTEIFSTNRWALLKEIAENPQSPTELASKTNTSISNITQQLKLLEAYNFVRREKSTEHAAGKPKTIYHLNNEIAHIILLRNKRAERKTFRIESNKTILSAVLTAGIDDAYYILKFMIKNEDLVKKCKAIGYIRSGKESIELLIITEYTDEIRAKCSNLFIEDISGKTKKIINWTHSEQEIDEGLARKDKHFTDIMRLVQPIYDPQDTLQRETSRKY